jgi:hypothetical protein
MLQVHHPIVLNLCGSISLALNLQVLSKASVGELNKPNDVFNGYIPMTRAIPY